MVFSYIHAFLWNNNNNTMWIIINTTFLQRIPIINLGLKQCIVPRHRWLFRCHGNSSLQQRRGSSRAGRWRDITGWGTTIRITSTAELFPQFMLHLWPTRDCLSAKNHEYLKLWVNIGLMYGLSYWLYALTLSSWGSTLDVRFDVRFWRLKSLPALKESTNCDGRRPTT